MSPDDEILVPAIEPVASDMVIQHNSWTAVLLWPGLTLQALFDSAFVAELVLHSILEQDITITVPMANGAVMVATRNVQLSLMHESTPGLIATWQEHWSMIERTYGTVGYQLYRRYTGSLVKLCPPHPPEKVPVDEFWPTPEFWLPTLTMEGLGYIFNEPVGVTKPMVTTARKCLSPAGWRTSLLNYIYATVHQIVTGLQGKGE